MGGWRRVVGKGYQAVEPSDPDVENGGVDVTALERWRLISAPRCR